ncbi:MAG: ATP-dependent Clp protease ATP-binding subunit ClpC [Mycobacterium sp.]|jgi:ATP-dependent Clp protease ATP-binding subunit ClpC|nr:ATP-dependent Clp protease ATP-binding subunit ClpC [Mycobacterium sp.]
MFSRFNPPARMVIVQSQKEARALKHSEVGSAHLLLGVLQQSEESVTRILESHGAELHAVRARVKETITVVDEGPEADAYIPFTVGAKRALAESVREALQLDHDYIGTEHLALGLLCDSDGDAVRVLADLQVDIGKLTRDIKQGSA